MKCPHCLVEYHSNARRFDIGADVNGYWLLLQETCPSCHNYVIILEYGKEPIYNAQTSEIAGFRPPSVAWFAFPQNGIARPPAPPEVPKDIAQDYREACLVLSDSPRASAALSRRCLQHILEDAGGAKQKNLNDQITAVISSGKLLSQIADALDALRNTGNFAAHPIKSQSTGEIVGVEPHEAEWNLDTLESLFDYYYVQPAKLKAKRDALNAKIQDAGKPPLK